MGRLEETGAGIRPGPYRLLIIGCDLHLNSKLRMTPNGKTDDTCSSTLHVSHITTFSLPLLTHPHRAMVANLPASLLLHPLSIYLFQTTLAACVLGFTSPSSPLRLTGLALQVTCVAILVSTSLHHTGRIFWASYFAGSGLTCLLQYIETALLSRWTFETQGIGSSAQRSSITSSANESSSKDKHKGTFHGTVWHRLRFGYRSIYSHRNIGTPNEVKNVPPFSAVDPQYVPSRARFLVDKAVIFLFCYMILDLATSGSPQPDANAINFSIRKVPLFSRLATVSGEELVIRLVTTLGLWVSLYCVLQAGTSLYAFVFVALCIDQPRDWPPSFGSLREAYSVRQFWG